MSPSTLGIPMLTFSLLSPRLQKCPTIHHAYKQAPALSNTHIHPSHYKSPNMLDNQDHSQLRARYGQQRTYASNQKLFSRERDKTAMGEHSLFKDERPPDKVGQGHTLTAGGQTVQKRQRIRASKNWGTWLSLPWRKVITSGDYRNQRDREEHTAGQEFQVQTLESPHSAPCWNP